jgi:hypothetical protein
MGRYDNLVEQIKTIDTEEVKDWDKNTDPDMKIVEEQKVYIWIRLYLKEESDVKEGDEVFMTYKPSGEKLSTIFICYGKTDLTKDHDDLEKITNFNPEDDKKILCLMVNQDHINKGTDIPFIRTLFKSGIHYEYQLVKRDELIFINSRTNDILDYFDCDY